MCFPMLSASPVAVPTHHFTVHLVVAANRQGLPRPRINDALWPKHVKFNLKVVPDTLGTCTAEAVSYLRGIVEAYDQVKPKDVVFFMHAHDTSWHAPVPMQQQILRLLNNDYLYSEPFGGMYCFDNDVWAAKGLVFGPDAHMPVPDLWSLMFDGTRWAQDTPSITGLQYPCCATFFVHGEMLLQHPPDDYRKVEQNLIKNCKRERELFPPKYPTPMARLMEGSWHLMLANVSRVPPPPYCPSKGPRWSSARSSGSHTPTQHHVHEHVGQAGLPPKAGGGGNLNSTKPQRHNHTSTGGSVGHVHPRPVGSTAMARRRS